MPQRKSFYQFISIHTFLIGLFPFYLPVFLWKLGYALSDISFFIAMSGLGYCAALWSWQRIQRKMVLKNIILISFLLELILLGAIYFSDAGLFYPILALLYGIYNCFFWIMNRVLFTVTVTASDSGKHYGNFQILVAIILKAGVFLGGFLLDRYGYSAVFVLSIVISALGSALFMLNRGLASLSREVARLKPVNLSGLLGFRDKFGSRLVFSIDGLFLFLESFFWMISLFIIVKESYWQLGMLVIGLMIAFGLIFYLIKNRIDRLPGQLMYRISVSLYILSWIMRGALGDDLQLPVVVLLLIMITFSTSMFRLAFNKRFFDLANTTTAFHYIFLKSYFSQLFLALIFTVIGLVLLNTSNVQQALRSVYLFAGLIAAGYYLYRPATEDSSENNTSRVMAGQQEH